MNTQDVERARIYYQQGDRVTARKMLATIVKSEPNNIQAWLLLAASLDDQKQGIYCVQRVLEIEPNNQNALKMLNAFQAVNEANIHVRLAKINKMKNIARAISSASVFLIMLGISIPCLIILIGVLFSK